MIEIKKQLTINQHIEYLESRIEQIQAYIDSLTAHNEYYPNTRNLEIIRKDKKSLSKCQAELRKLKNLRDTNKHANIIQKAITYIYTQLARFSQ
jgi:prefoldin subunit 5